MNFKKTIPFFILAVCTLGLITCTKTKEKEETIEEKAHEIEKEYENTADDFNEATDQPAPPEQEVYVIKEIKSGEEADATIRELRKCVTIHRDLVKKHSATGQAKYKEQAYVLEEKGRKLQESLRKSEFQLRSKQVKEAGDLFGELEASTADLSR